MGAALPSSLLAQAETVDLPGARAELGAEERKFPRKKNIAKKDWGFAGNLVS